MSVKVIRSDHGIGAPHREQGGNKHDWHVIGSEWLRRDEMYVNWACPCGAFRQVKTTLQKAGEEPQP